MKKEFKPVVGGRASICTWEIEFYFLDKQQARSFIKLLIKDEIDFSFDYEKVLDQADERHYVTVTGCWATNMVRVAQMAEEVDYVG
jgi:hypothetical protein